MTNTEIQNALKVYIGNTEVSSLYIGNTLVWEEQSNSGSTANLFDILYSDSSGNLSYTSEILPISEGKIPIALCIAEAGFFGINEPARWMSLKLMNPSDPNNGTLSTSIGINVFGSTINSITSIPSVYKNGGTNGYLYDVDTTKTPQIPSLFDINEDWNLNELGEKNEYAITHVNGKIISNLMIENSTSQQNWKTDSTIINNSGDNYFSAACCCWRYNTLGTQQGDWYLGGCGELAMLAVYRSFINNLLSQISSTYSNYCISVLPNNSWYGTSTNISSEYYLLHTDNGGIIKYGKTSTRIIALLQY